MSDDDRASEERESSLELPSLRAAFRRRRVDADARRDRTEPPAEGPAKEKRQLRPIRVHAPRVHVPRVHVPGSVAAALVGAVVGLALVGLTAAGLHGCTAWRGTTSCGTPGVVLLVLIAALAAAVGSLLLRLAGVDSPGSTSVLGVALLAVVVLLALVPVLGHWWVAIVVPALAMVTYVGSWWLTSSVGRPSTGQGGSERPHTVAPYDSV